MSEYQHTISCERLIAADVIGVDVRVDQVANVAVTEFSYDGHQVLGMWLKLGVDKQYTLFAYKYANIGKAIGSLNHVHTPRHWYGAEFHIEKSFANLSYNTIWR
jgi:hypothetical protein